MLCEPKYKVAALSEAIREDSEAIYSMMTKSTSLTVKQTHTNTNYHHVAFSPVFSTKKKDNNT